VIAVSYLLFDNVLREAWLEGFGSGLCMMHSTFLRVWYGYVSLLRLFRDAYELPPVYGEKEEEA
jgi:hypothetical protein